MNSKPDIGLIILAAGASRRLGTPKQLLPFRGETLLRRITRQAVESVCRPVVAVFGREAEKFRKHLAGFDIHAVKNFDWEQGMGTSIRAGVEKLLEIDHKTGGAVLTVCDQPFVTSSLINRLVENFHQTEAAVIASQYAETGGVPALFSRRLFPELLDLQTAVGAREIIRRFSAETIPVAFPEGEIDIDTMEDFRLLEAQE